MSSATPPSPAAAASDVVFDQLWAANHTALHDQDYETACHALQAALARARFLRDEVRVIRVGREATRQHDFLFGQPRHGSTLVWPQDLHPAKRHAIETVYTSIVAQVPVILEYLQHAKHGS